MLYNIIHGFGGHYKCRGYRPRHGGGGGGTNPRAAPGPHLQPQVGARNGATVAGASNTAPGHSAMTATAIYSVIYNAIILYSIDMHIKHAP